MLKRIYEPSAYREPTGLQSYWSETEDRRQYPVLEGSVEADVVIVGEGYAGLNASLRLVCDTNALSLF